MFIVFVIVRRNILWQVRPTAT